jgi:predicted metal-dependent hydrolase
MDQDQPRKLTYQDHEISFRVLRSRRRGLLLSLDPEEGLLVRAPLRASLEQVDRLVLDKAPWVLKHLQRLARQGLPPRPHAFQDGETFPFQGRDRVLQVLLARRGGRPGAELMDGRLVVLLGQELGPEARALAVARALALWYRRQAALWLPPRAAAFALALGLKPPLVRVRDQKRRWGSCGRQGVLQLNWRLVMAPPELADYVAAHEVCHLLVRGHSPRFWGLVAGLLPDYAARRARLRQSGQIGRASCRERVS